MSIPKRSWRVGVLLLAISCDQPAKPPNDARIRPSPPGEVGSATPVAYETLDRGDPSEQFLMHADSGELMLKVVGSDDATVLAKHADGVLYDPALELLWFRDGSDLLVIDLRLSESRPVVIARGLPEINRFSIEHPTGLAETEDNCDLPVIALDWNKASKIECVLDPTPRMHIENTGWLQANLDRPARSVPERREFGERRVRLPRRLLNCEDVQQCGSAIAFGADGLELVRVSERQGGDCWQRTCLLRDSNTGRFATPPDAPSWGTAEKTPGGSCGIFLFDNDGSRFLLGHRMCVSMRACTELGGTGLGWRVPGARVGAPGSE